MLRLLLFGIGAVAAACAGRVGPTPAPDVTIAELSLAADLAPGEERVDCNEEPVARRAFVRAVRHERTHLPHRLDVLVLAPGDPHEASDPSARCDVALASGASVYTSFGPGGRAEFEVGSEPIVESGGGLALRVHAMNPLAEPVAAMAYARVDLEVVP